MDVLSVDTFGWPKALPQAILLGRQVAPSTLAPPEGALIRDVGFDPDDAGPLRIARYTEPFALLIGQLGCEGEGGPNGRIGLGNNKVLASCTLC
jgi:hypothetical protein